MLGSIIGGIVVAIVLAIMGFNFSHWQWWVGCVLGNFLVAVIRHYA